MDHPPPQHGVVLLRLPDAPGLFHRVNAQALVGAAGAAVQLLDAVEPPLFIGRIPPTENGLETRNRTPGRSASAWEWQWGDHMGPALILIVGRVIAPLGEHLPEKLSQLP